MNTAKENSKAAFNQQAATYDKGIKGQHARSLYPVLLEKLSHIPFQSALDLGCGTGEMLKLILQEDAGKELYGIDLSEKMLHVAKSKLPEQVKLLLGDSEALPFSDNTFDVVYCNDSFHHYPSPMNVLREVQRVLKPGGTFLMGDCWQPLVGRIIMISICVTAKRGMSRFTPKRKLFLCFQSIFVMYHGSKLEIPRVLLWAKND